MNSGSERLEKAIEEAIRAKMNENGGTAVLRMKATGRELFVTKSVWDPKDWTLYDGCELVVGDTSPEHICHLIRIGKCYR